LFRQSAYAALQDQVKTARATASAGQDFTIQRSCIKAQIENQSNNITLAVHLHQQSTPSMPYR